MTLRRWQPGDPITDGRLNRSVEVVNALLSNPNGAVADRRGFRRGQHNLVWRVGIIQSFEEVQTGQYNYTLREAYKSAAGYDQWTVRGESATLTAYNLGEDQANGTSAVAVGQPVDYFIVLAPDGEGGRVEEAWFSPGGLAQSKTLHMEVFTSSGTFTTPATPIQLVAIVTAGGGGGGSSANANDTVTDSNGDTWTWYEGGAGGGGGGESVVVAFASKANQDITVTVGGGGAAGAANGDDSSIEYDYLSAWPGDLDTTQNTTTTAEGGSIGSSPDKAQPGVGGFGGSSNFTNPDGDASGVQFWPFAGHHGYSGTTGGPNTKTGMQGYGGLPGLSFIDNPVASHEPSAGQGGRGDNGGGSGSQNGKGGYVMFLWWA